MKYFKERNDVPKGNLVEVRYEDFIQQPLKELKSIYTKLQLDGFDKSEKTFNEYIASQTNVKIQKYIMDESIKQRIYREWKFAFDNFDYTE
jgi:hypothetical protein